VDISKKEGSGRSAFRQTGNQIRYFSIDGSSIDKRKPLSKGIYIKTMNKTGKCVIVPSAMVR
jgi:hypothetical protein